METSKNPGPEKKINGVKVAIITVVVFAFLVAVKPDSPISNFVKEKIALNNAKRENSYASYELFINKFPNSKKIGDVKSLQETAFWFFVKNGNDLRLLDFYSNRYSSGVYLKDANELKESLIWQEVCKSNLLSDYKKYIYQYPNGKYVSEAHSKIDGLFVQGSFKDSRDSREYKTVQIGPQVWMAENLASTKYTDGTDIPLVNENLEWSNLSSGAYCWYAGKTFEDGNTDGALYNWYTVNTGNLCPIGWRVPSRSDWRQLLEYIGKSTDQSIRNESGIFDLLANISPEKEKSIGFNSTPSGTRYNGYFSGISQIASWWSSTEVPNTSNAFATSLYYYSSRINTAESPKNCGFSVRCIKGQSSEPSVDMHNTIYGTPYTIAEVNPSFPGGNEAIKKFIVENTVYPEAARANKIEGTVVVKCVVTWEGQIDQVAIERGVCSVIDDEAIRVIKSLPKFNPGQSGGNPVNVSQTFAVVFRDVPKSNETEK
jgi:TonB family protein